MSLLVLLFSCNACALEKWLIFLIFKVCTLVCFKNLVCLLALFLSKLAKYLVSKCLCENVCVTICCLNANLLSNNAPSCCR